MKKKRHVDPSTITDVGAARLEAIRERMGLSIVEFFRLLHVSKETYSRVRTGRSPCRIAYVELAEAKLAAFLKTERRLATMKANAEAKAEAARPKTIVEIETDPDVKAKVISLYIRGKNKPDIASTLALRPEVVDHYLKCIENIDADG